MNEGFAKDFADYLRIYLEAAKVWRSTPIPNSSEYGDFCTAQGKLYGYMRAVSQVDRELCKKMRGWMKRQEEVIEKNYPFKSQREPSRTAMETK